MKWILYGFKSCGKSTVAKLVAAKLGKRCIDIDRLIEELDGVRLNFKEIYRQRGKEAFRALERKAVEKIQDLDDLIVAAGGGTVLDADNRRLLKANGVFIFLDVDKELLKKRILAYKELPAIFDPSDPSGSFDKLYAERKPLYSQMADEVIKVVGATPEAIAVKVCRVIQH